MMNELAFSAAVLEFITICCGIFHAFFLKGISLPFFKQMHETNFIQRSLIASEEGK
ncbi:RAxF-45 family protein [Jeotgalibacillus proteolyticus]|uniref:RAxF-45 family protein n=1 Tax=Jeotgalibacillus proteolyticus TaxID=2082395 RepID=UPI00268D700B